MKIRFIKKVKVNDFHIFNGIFAFTENINSKSYLKLFTENLDIEWEVESYQYIAKINNFICVYDIDSNYKIYDFDGHLLTSISGISIINFVKNEFIISDHKDKKAKKINLKGESLWEMDSKLSPQNFIFEDKIFSNKYLQKKDFYCFDLNNGGQIWHCSLSALDTLYPNLGIDWEIGHFFCVVNSILWLNVNNKAEGAILGVNVQTGKILHFIHQVIAQTPVCIYNELPCNNNTQYDAKTNKMIGFDRAYYWEIDLNTQLYKANIWNFDEELKKHYTEFPRARGSVMNETHIFAFSGALGAFCKSMIFAFNRQTFKIDWQYELQNVPMKIKIIKKKIFVLDSGGTLHIFEKENA